MTLLGIRTLKANILVEVQRLVRVCVSVCKNISPEQVLFSKGQAREQLRNKTDFISHCQLLSSMRALQKLLLFSKPDISEHHKA